MLIVINKKALLFQGQPDFLVFQGLPVRRAEHGLDDATFQHTVKRMPVNVKEDGKR